MDDKCKKSSIIFLEELLRKEHEFVSSEDALRDVTPPQWSDDALRGKAKIVVETKEAQLYEKARVFASAQRESWTGFTASKLNAHVTILTTTKKQPPHTKSQDLSAEKLL